jgi:hypothetical protein
MKGTFRPAEKIGAIRRCDNGQAGEIACPRQARVDNLAGKPRDGHAAGKEISAP